MDLSRCRDEGPSRCRDEGPSRCPGNIGLAWSAGKRRNSLILILLLIDIAIAIAIGRVSKS